MIGSVEDSFSRSFTRRPTRFLKARTRPDRSSSAPQQRVVTRWQERPLEVISPIADRAAASEKYSTLHVGKTPTGGRSPVTGNSCRRNHLENRSLDTRGIRTEDEMPVSAVTNWRRRVLGWCISQLMNGEHRDASGPIRSGVDSTQFVMRWRIVK